MKRLTLLITLIMLCSCIFSAPAVTAETENVQTITLSSEKSDEKYSHAASLDGKKLNEYDYTWNIDPATDHGEVKNSPAEYYTGTKPNENDGIYIAHDIYYYPMLEESKFKEVTYDGEKEWVYFYEAKGYENYIFSTLPTLKTGFPSQMMHSAEEAFQNAVLHITKPGTYKLKGNWHGQVRIDLGEDSYDQPSQKVTLILDGVDIECTVASAVVFAEVYECDNTWEDREEHTYKADTTNAGANIIIADGSENNLSGTNIFRILKTQYKDDESTDTYPAQKKRLKVDGALYSYRSLNITGEEKNTGKLNITSGFEGLNTELHLTINGGNINIFSQDDGVNVNEDGVSVFAVNDGNLHICAGLGAEGDGIDSNGYMVVNGGTVISAANPAADSGMDSDCGSYVFGGTVVALGATMDWAKADDSADTTQAVMNLRFSTSQNSDEAIIITDNKDKVVFAYDPDKDEIQGENKRTYSGAIISNENLKIGDSYRIYIDGDLSGDEYSGVYKKDTVTEFTNSIQQCYSSNQMAGMGGGRPNGNRPTGDGFDGQMPENMQNIPQKPDGNFQPEDMPQGENFQGRFPQNETSNSSTCTFQSEFKLSQAVNDFSSVTDYTHSLEKAENSDNYICTACGATFKDAEGKQMISAPKKQIDTRLIPYALTFLAGAAFASLIFTIVIICKKRKK